MKKSAVKIWYVLGFSFGETFSLIWSFQLVFVNMFFSAFCFTTTCPDLVVFQVLDLQDEIANLKAYHVDEGTGENKTIGLEDICFAPLAPQNKNCTIVSVLNYFQNSHEMLDKNATDGFFITADYHDHILSCTA